MKIQDVTPWAFFNTGSGRNFISGEAARKLKLAASRYETHQMVTLHGAKKTKQKQKKTALTSLPHSH